MKQTTATITNLGSELIGSRLLHIPWPFLSAIVPFALFLSGNFRRKIYPSFWQFEIVYENRKETDFALFYASQVNFGKGFPVLTIQFSRNPAARWNDDWTLTTSVLKGKMVPSYLILSHLTCYHHYMLSRIMAFTCTTHFEMNAICGSWDLGHSLRQRKMWHKMS